MVSGRFFWLSKVPGCFFTVPGGFYGFSRFQVGFSRFQVGFSWFQAGFSRFQMRMYGYLWHKVCFMVPCWFLMFFFKALGFFMVPGPFYGFKRL